MTGEHQWRDRRVLVTGHTGFKGGWLSIWLQRLGAEVTGVALKPPTDPSVFDVARVAEGMTSIVGDIRDFGLVERVISECRPEVIFHMAAQSLVRASYEEPIETISTNVVGTAHVLEAARRVDGVRAIVNVTSDKCYDNQEWVWGYRENEPLGGKDPYSASKACAELVTSAYRHSYFSRNGGPALASARAGNVVGGGDWADDRLVPDIIRSFSVGDPVRIRKPQAVRPWQHVLEPLSGYLTLAEGLRAEGARYAEAWNFGPPDRAARTVGWVTEELIQRWPSEASWLSEEDGPPEAGYLRLDSTKAKTRLGWAPRLTLEEALDWVVEWYTAHQDGEDMRAVTERQIDRYESRESPAAGRP